MKDEEYVFLQDIKEKKSIARGAFHKKGGSKSKKCTLPSDYLTRKEREKMNGEVKRWNMNDFYTWNEFKEMPKDIAAAYISTLNQKYRVSVGVICSELFHKSKTYVSTYLHENGIAELMKTTPYTNRGNSKVIDDFKKAILAARVPTTEVPADIFIPDGMAPGYCSDGTKVEDAIKEAVDAANKKLIEDPSISSDDLLAGMDSILNVSHNTDGTKVEDAVKEVIDSVNKKLAEDADIRKEFGVPDGETSNLPYTLPKPEKEHPSVSSLSFVMHGIDKGRIDYILSWFYGKNVTVTLNITEKM